MPEAREAIVGELDAILRSSGRRDFLRLAAAGGMGVIFPTVIAGCSNDTIAGATTSAMLDFSTDAGVLNYAYALEQLEADFYARVVANPYTGITPAELTLLAGIQDHEVLHRDYLRSVITNERIGDQLIFKYPGVDFANRTSVLGTAIAFEDLGVSAYNGAGKYVKSSTYLTVVGKIVSVEARHASALRDIVNGGASFAGDDVVNAANGLDGAKSPTVVLGAASAYVSATITTTGVLA